VTRGTKYKLALRWVSEGVITLFVNGVKSVQATVAGGMPSQTATSTFYRGMNESAASHFNGAIYDIDISAAVYDDAEMIGRQNG
jgi:hypothetical protein